MNYFTGIISRGNLLPMLQPLVELDVFFAPHFGRTLKELNESIPGRISDHNPITVDLPLEEPPVDYQLEPFSTDANYE